MPVRKRNGPLLEGGGALRAAILKVRRAIDVSGRRLPKIAVKLTTPGGECWASLPEHDLVQKKTGCLIDFAVAHDIDTSDMEEADLKILCGQLRAAAKMRVVLLQRPGYFRVLAAAHEAEGFVYANRIYWANKQGQPGKVICVTDRDVVPASCSLTRWKRKVGVLFEGQRYMTVALGATLCALLVRALDLHKISLFIIGESSMGKSALQRACLSASRSGDELESATGTVLGLQMRMSERPDEAVHLEDARQAGSSADLPKLIFDVGNGAARAVGSAGQRAIVGEPAHCTLVVSNERTIAEGARGASGVQIDAGMSARVFELVIEAEHGAFDAFAQDQEPAEFAEKLASRSRNYFGALWPEWVEVVAHNLQEIRRQRDREIPRMRQILETAVEAKDPVLKRMISGYAGWMFALSVAIDYDLIPLTKQEVRGAFVSVLVEQQTRRGVGQTRQQNEILGSVRHALDRNPKFFVPWADRSNVFNGMWGYTREFEGERYYLLLPRMLGELCKGFGDRDALRALEGASLLKTNTGEKTLSVRLNPGEKPKRFYAISARIQGDG